jgi:recombination protein RecR
MKYPASIQRLINILTALPSVGPKTAERYVFSLLKWKGEDLDRLEAGLRALRSSVTTCSACLSYAETDPCPICSDSKREKDKLLIVADSRSLSAIESTNQYGGLFFVLGGEIDTIEDIRPDQLNVKQLAARLQENGIKEIILALNPTIEGETTSLYLNKLVKQSFPGIKVSRLARGLPMGADVEYADEITLSNALKFRNEL